MNIHEHARVDPHPPSLKCGSLDYWEFENGGNVHSNFWLDGCGCLDRKFGNAGIQPASSSLHQLACAASPRICDCEWQKHMASNRGGAQSGYDIKTTPFGSASLRGTWAYSDWRLHCIWTLRKSYRSGLEMAAMGSSEKSREALPSHTWGVQAWGWSTFFYNAPSVQGVFTVSASRWWILGFVNRTVSLIMCSLSRSEQEHKTIYFGETELDWQIRTVWTAFQYRFNKLVRARSMLLRMPLPVLQ